MLERKATRLLILITLVTLASMIAIAFITMPPAYGVEIAAAEASPEWLVLQKCDPDDCYVGAFFSCWAHGGTVQWWADDTTLWCGAVCGDGDRINRPCRTKIVVVM